MNMTTAASFLSETKISIFADHGLGIRERVLPLAVLRVPVEEFVENLDTLDLPDYRDPQMVNVVGVKVMADGIPPNRTSWMHEPFVQGWHRRDVASWLATVAEAGAVRDGGLEPVVGLSVLNDAEGAARLAPPSG